MSQDQLLDIYNKTKKVEVVDVSPRDGLQNEPRGIPTSDKIALIEKLVASGVQHVEVGAFVSPRWVPQMADSDAVIAGLKLSGTSYSVLLPNNKGFAKMQGAVERSTASISEIAVFVSASEGFSQANLNCSVSQSLEHANEVMVSAKGAGYSVRAYVSNIIACPFDGPTSPSRVVEVVAKLLANGAGQVSLGDTTGVGVPATVDAVLAAITTVADPTQLAGHFHDTGGRAIDNVEVALKHGLRCFDGSVGGLGGCPYAPGAPGNLATETLVAALHSWGYDTGIDEERLAQAAAFAKGLRYGD